MRKGVLLGLLVFAALAFAGAATPQAPETAIQTGSDIVLNDDAEKLQEVGVSAATERPFRALGPQASIAVSTPPLGTRSSGIRAVATRCFATVCSGCARSPDTRRFGFPRCSTSRRV